jgi:hypothetical protein
MLNRRGFMVGAATSVGAMTVMSSEVLSAQEPTMSLNVIYPNLHRPQVDGHAGQDRVGLPTRTVVENGAPADAPRRRRRRRPRVVRPQAVTLETQ